jgi:hypothetical protein
VPEALDAVGRWLASQKDMMLLWFRAISADLPCQQVMLSQLHIDRAYRSHTLVRERSAQLQMYCKA